MKIAIVGTGYVGLVTGTCFAETGNDVVCIDVDVEKVERMRQGQVPIYEPGLEVVFQRNIEAGRLHFTSQLSEGIEGASIIFLALPTPPNDDGGADLSYVLQVAEQIGTMIRDYTIIINKSTVPVGTADKVREVISKNCSVPFDVVSNPEFLREGFAIEDFMKPDRVVIGTSSDRAQNVLRTLYEPFVLQDSPLLFMDEKSAEITKYAANSFLAMKISFMNEVANLCKVTGADVDNVRLGIGSDERIGNRFLFAGAGYGGSCFPKDVRAFQKTARDYDYDFKILQAVTQVNDLQRVRMFESIKAYFGGQISGKTFAVWGIAFKPDTDDIREAPALYFIDALTAAGAKVVAYDPEAGSNAQKRYANTPNVQIAHNQYEALERADALIVLTEWPVFRSPDFAIMKKTLAAPVIFDGRNLYAPHEVENAGFYYESIGRQTVDGTL